MVGIEGDRLCGISWKPSGREEGGGIQGARWRKWINQGRGRGEVSGAIFA